MSAESPASPGEVGAEMESASALFARADSLRPLIENHAGEQESLGRLHDEVVEAFHEAGFFTCTAPREVGGLELGPRDHIELIARLSYADASAGWVFFATSGCVSIAGAFLDDEAAAEVFGGDRDPVIAGQGTRPGKARVEDDGFRLSGDWSFGSGIKHAGWAHSAGLVEETGEVRIFVTPVERAELLDNWDVMGLRATGSIDYSMRDVAVPAPFTHLAATTEPRRGGPFYGVGVVGIASLGHTGWALGVGRRMLDEIQALVAQKAGRPGSVAENEAFLLGYADAEAGLRAAKALVEEVWGGIEETVQRGDSLGVREHTLLRMALANSTWTAQAVGQFVYQWSGTTGLRAGTLQRYFRDLNAGTQHITSGPGVRAAVGRELLGAAPNHEWLFLNLVER